jgi:hypothetical protein
MKTRKKKETLPRGYTQTPVMVIDLNAVSARRVIPGDFGWPTTVQLSYTTNLKPWNFERNTGEGWTHLGRVTGGAIVNMEFDRDKGEPRWRLVEVPA